MSKLSFSSFLVDPIGEIEKQKYIQSLFLLKKHAGKLRKVKVNKQSHKF